MLSDLTIVFCSDLTIVFWHRVSLPVLGFACCEVIKVRIIMFDAHETF